MVELGCALSSERFPPEKLVSKLPTHFEKTVELIEPGKITEDVILGPDRRKHIDAINKFVDAGFDHVYVHQIGPGQEQFFQFYTEKILPNFGTASKTSNGSARSDRSRWRERDASAYGG